MTVATEKDRTDLIDQPVVARIEQLLDDAIKATELAGRELTDDEIDQLVIYYSGRGWLCSAVETAKLAGRELRDEEICLLTSVIGEIELPIF